MLPLLVRLMLAGASLIFSVLAAKVLDHKEYTLLYSLISVAVIGSVLIKFGGDQTLKAKYDPDGNGVGSIWDALPFGFGVAINLMFMIYIWLEFGYSYIVLGWGIFTGYTLVSLMGLKFRLEKMKWRPLFYEPLMMYLIMTACLPVTSINFEVYIISCGISIIVFQYLICKPLKFSKINYLPSLKGIKKQGRAKEGLVSVSSTLSQWMIINYLANSGLQKEYIIAHQLILIIGTIRSIDLNWNYIANIEKVDKLSNAKSKLLLWLICRGLFALVAGLLLYRAFEIVFGFEFDLLFYFVLLVNEIIAFGTSPLVANLQRGRQKNKINLGLTYLTVPILILAISRVDLTYILGTILFFGIGKFGVIYYAKQAAHSDL